MKALPDSDTLIQYALGTLEPEQMLEVAAALEVSPTLRLEVAAWQKSLYALSSNTPMHNAPANLEQRILEQVRTVPQSIPVAAKTNIPATIEPKTNIPATRAPIWTQVIAVAAIAGVAVLGWRGQQLETQISGLQQQASTRASVLAQSSSVQLVSTTQKTAIGTAFLTRDGQTIITLRLPAPPKGKTYQAWFIAKGEAAPKPLQTFNSSLDTSLPSTAAVIAISLEPAGGSSVPTEVLGTGEIKF